MRPWSRRRSAGKFSVSHIPVAPSLAEVNVLPHSAPRTARREALARRRRGQAVGQEACGRVPARARSHRAVPLHCAITLPRSVAQGLLRQPFPREESHLPRRRHGRSPRPRRGLRRMVAARHAALPGCSAAWLPEVPPNILSPAASRMRLGPASQRPGLAGPTTVAGSRFERMPGIAIPPPTPSPWTVTPAAARACSRPAGRLHTGPVCLHLFHPHLFKASWTTRA